MKLTKGGVLLQISFYTFIMWISDCISIWCGEEERKDDSEWLNNDQNNGLSWFNIPEYNNIPHEKVKEGNNNTGNWGTLAEKLEEKSIVASSILPRRIKLGFTRTMIPSEQHMKKIKNVTFTKEEWNNFNISPINSIIFVKSGNSYWIPSIYFTKYKEFIKNRSRSISRTRSRTTTGGDWWNDLTNNFKKMGDDIGKIGNNMGKEILKVPSDLDKNIKDATNNFLYHTEYNNILNYILDKSDFKDIGLEKQNIVLNNSLNKINKDINRLSNRLKIYGGKKKLGGNIIKSGNIIIGIVLLNILSEFVSNTLKKKKKKKKKKEKKKKKKVIKLKI